MADAAALESDGLICAYQLDGRGGARKLGWDDLKRDIAAEGPVWIHLDFTHPQTLSWLRGQDSLGPIVVEALTDDDSRPRAFEQGDGMLAMFRGVNLNPGSSPEDMVSIRVWLQRDRVISTRRRRLLSVDAIRKELEEGTGPRDAASFLVSLVGHLGDRIGPAVDRLDTEVEVAEQRFEHAGSGYRGEFSNLRRQAVRIRRFLQPQRDALAQLAKHAGGLLSDHLKAELREEADRLTRFLEDLDLVRERSMVAQEELLANMAQQQNSRIYVLSIVAAVFLPLSFLTGLMGMNVAGLPGTEDPWAFGLLVLMMAAVCAGILGLFKLKKWF